MRTASAQSLVGTNLHGIPTPQAEKPLKAGLFPPEDPREPTFIKDFSKKELISFILLSIVQSNPLLLNTAIKALPYTPNALVKHFVSPIYCGGETYDEVFQTGKKLLNRGVGNMMLSYAVEDAEGSNTDPALLKEVVNVTCQSMDQVLVRTYDESCKPEFSGVVHPTTGFIALKPTGLQVGAAAILEHYNKPEYAQAWKEYLQVCREVCQYAVDNGQGKVVIVFDAEKRHLQDGCYAAQRAMMEEFNRGGQIVVVGTIQMYLQDSMKQLEADIADAKSKGYQLGMKLVRGAYLHSEPDRWNVIHKSKLDSDNSYNQGVSECLDSILDGKHDGAVGKLIIASHNEESSAMAHNRLSQHKGIDLEMNNKVVFGQLMGMCDDHTAALAKAGRSVVKYVPWGPIKETKEYLIRRLEENGDAARQGGWKYVKHGIKELLSRIA